jgi:hypothetical protein
MAKRKKAAAKVTAPKRTAKKREPKAAGSGGNGRPLTTADNRRAADDDMRELFLSHRRTWNGWMAKVKALAEVERDLKAALKADGFKVLQFQIADNLSGSPKQEQKVRAAVEDRLKVARWIGHPMGAQLDLFAQPDRTPSVDVAFDAGKMASMNNEPAKPPYDPNSEQFRQYMAGYHEHQGKLAKGFKPLDANANGAAETHGEAEDKPAAGFGPSRLPPAVEGRG